jgi:hypothetical protein
VNKTDVDLTFIGFILCESRQGTRKTPMNVSSQTVTWAGKEKGQGAMWEDKEGSLLYSRQ